MWTKQGMKTAVARSTGLSKVFFFDYDKEEQWEEEQEHEERKE